MFGKIHTLIQKNSNKTLIRSPKNEIILLSAFLTILEYAVKRTTWYLFAFNLGKVQQNFVRKLNAGKLNALLNP